MDHASTIYEIGASEKERAFRVIVLVADEIQTAVKYPLSDKRCFSHTTGVRPLRELARSRGRET